MKKIFFLLLGINFLLASNILITAKSFKYDNKKNISYFREDVNVTKENDNILSNYLTVYFDKNKKIDKMVANGNVRFLIHNENSTYKGISNSITYLPKKSLFIFEGKVHIIKLEDNQQLFGNKVIINKKTGEARVFGEKKKPVKFILKVKN